MRLDKAAKLEKKLRTDQFTLEDFLEQMDQIRNMGSLGDILSMLPGGAQSFRAPISMKSRWPAPRPSSNP